MKNFCIKFRNSLPSNMEDIEIVDETSKKLVGTGTFEKKFSRVSLNDDRELSLDWLISENLSWRIPGEY